MTEAPTMQRAVETTQDYTAAMCEDPTAYLDLPLPLSYDLSSAEREAIELTGLQKRFAALRDKVKVLGRMAAEQKIEEINDLRDASYLLFPHTVYKSYPMSVLERGQFDRLTRWLQGLTTVDLSGFSTDGIETIDDWVKALNDRAGVQLVHTSGTTGKLSFLPRDRADQDDRLRLQAYSIRDYFGANSGPDIFAKPRPVVYPSYRYGGGPQHRSVDSMVRLVARGDEDKVLTLYPGYFSADLASLAGRIRVAEARGELGSLQISPALLARRDEALSMEKDRAAMLDAFFAEAERRFAGQDVLIIGVKKIIYDWASEGLKRGIRKLFGPGTVLVTGGGDKGHDFPVDAEAQISEFLGNDGTFKMYAMTEMTGFCRQCEHGNYHIPPYFVVYVLDPDTGEAMPREGRQTGRFGFVDLYPADHWGGFVTGDKVTVQWSAPCDCGRKGPYVEPEIQRFSELQGGDDKITCAGAPAAHDKALEYLASIAG